ncbi:MAG TPA: PstS family phosphate ABC transporter substrate-binding protein [Abditibacteriaceae bacterium]|jgi:phosphate transport system substrate-binding protein
MNKKVLWGIAPLALGMALAGCGGNSGSEGGEKAAAGTTGNTTANSGADLSSLSGAIKIDGSSTVEPISAAIAEGFNGSASKVNISVAASGTGGGLKKFAKGEIDIAGASRPMKSKEADEAKKNKIEYLELPVAYDGLSVVVNPKNTWAKSLTTAELKKIWGAGSKVNNWSQVRAGFPNKPLKLYGPGTASGTFDYFSEEILGKDEKSRADYNASEDDNTLVKGVSSDEGALGYFGFAYYEDNAAKLKLVAVDNGKGAVAPSKETIISGSYAPLSRPLFIYVNRKAMDKPEVAAFVDYYLNTVKEIVGTVGYVPLPDAVYDAVKARRTAKTVGSAYTNAADGATLETLYGAK